MISLCRHDKSFMNNTVRRSMPSSKCRRPEVMARMYLAAKTVPDPNGSDWKSSVAVGWESGTRNRQLMRRSGTQTPSELRLCWMMTFIGEIWRCQAMKTFINWKTVFLHCWLHSERFRYRLTFSAFTLCFLDTSDYVPLQKLTGQTSNMRNDWRRRRMTAKH